MVSPNEEKISDKLSHTTVRSVYAINGKKHFIPYYRGVNFFAKYIKTL